MRIEFEDWVKNQNFTQSVVFLYEESFKSFRGQAFSAALMYTHLAFFESIKQKIRRVQSIPDGINQIEWERNYLKPILNDDTWDTSIYTFLTQKDNTTKTKKIFNLSDVLREEITYWKNKRNTAVHFRNQKINFFHVESYWNFIESNYSKINVIGSKTSFLNKIEDFFNTDLTSINDSFQPLIDGFNSSFDSTDLSFFEKIITASKKNDNNRWPNFINSLIKTYYNSQILDQVNQYFEDDKNIETLYLLLRNDSLILRIIKLEQNIVRILWRTKLFKSGLNDFHILLQLFKNYSYLSKTCDEIYEYIFDDVINQEIFPDSITQKELGVEFKNSFSKKLFNELDKNWDFKRINKNSNYIIKFLNSYKIEDFWIQCILTQIDAPFKPNEFIPKFKAAIQDNNNIKTTFQNYILLNPDYNNSIKSYFFTQDQIDGMSNSI